MNKTYLVAGGGGRLGCSFVETVCKYNIDQVKALRLFDLGFTPEVRQRQTECCEEANIAVDWIEGDVTNREEVRAAVRGSDVVLHMASVIDVYETIPEEKIRKINVGGTMNLLNACCDMGVKYFIYTSTTHACGPNRAGDPFVDGDEETPYVFDETHAYGLTKKEAEQVVLEANGRNIGSGEFLTTCCLRPCGIYGENDGLCEELIGSRAQRRTIYTITKRSQKQSRMYIANAAWCHALAAKQIQEKSNLVGGNAYFLGDDTPNKSLARIVLEFCKHEGYRIGEPEPIIPTFLMLWFAIIVNTMSKLLVKFGITRFQKFPTPYVLRQVWTNFTVVHRRFQNDFGYVPLYTWEESSERMRRWVTSLLTNRDGNRTVQASC